MTLLTLTLWRWRLLWKVWTEERLQVWCGTWRRDLLRGWTGNSALNITQLVNVCWWIVITLFVVDDVCMSGMDHQTGEAVPPAHSRPGLVSSIKQWWRALRYYNKTKYFRLSPFDSEARLKDCERGNRLQLLETKEKKLTIRWQFLSRLGISIRWLLWWPDRIRWRYMDRDCDSLSSCRSQNGYIFACQNHFLHFGPKIVFFSFFGWWL